MEKLDKLVHILESSEDREEKLEALRLISEIAKALPDVKAASNEFTLKVDDIPLPSLPQRGMAEIPLPSDPPPTQNSLVLDVQSGDSRSFSTCFRLNRFQKTNNSEETAVTKTRLGMVTLHKNKSCRFQMIRHSLNDLMLGERSNKSKLTKMKKKSSKNADGEMTSSESKCVASDILLTLGKSRRTEIQQRINTWKEELLRDMNRDSKRNNLDLAPVNLNDQKHDSCAPQKEVASLTSLSSASATSIKLIPHSITDEGVMVSKTITTSSLKSSTESLTSRFSSIVFGADSQRKYYWPLEMIRHTTTLPKVSYSCNPLYFEFLSQLSPEKKSLDSITAMNSISPITNYAKNINKPDEVSSINKHAWVKENKGTIGIDSASLPETQKIFPMLEKKPLDASKQAVLTDEESLSYVKLLGNTFDDDDHQTNAAKWDTSSESEPEKANVSSQKFLEASARERKYSNPAKDRSKKWKYSSDSDHSTHDSSSNYSYRSRRNSHSSVSSRSRSYSSTYSSRKSSRHRCSYRSYSRSSRCSRSSSYFSSSSDSYYSSSSTRRRKRRWRSRSLEGRSLSRDRFGRRISRSPSPISRKQHKSCSKEPKRIINCSTLPQAKKLTAKVGSITSTNRIKEETLRPAEECLNSISTSSLATSTTLSSLNIPLPAPNLLLSTDQSTPNAAPTEPAKSFIGPTLPTAKEIVMPSKELSQEEKFQPIGPNDPLVFKTKLASSSGRSVEDEKYVKKSEKEISASFIIPPEQAEHYKALRLQAERHARKVMGGITGEGETEEDELTGLVDVSLESSNQVVNSGNPQQQLVEELYLEQMASLMAQQHQNQLVMSAQAPVGRLFHIVGGQQNMASNSQFIPLVQLGAKVVPALPQAGAPLILAHHNAGHVATMFGSQTPSPTNGNSLVQVQTEDSLKARLHIELAEKTLPERQEWVQILQLPQQQQHSQHHGLILTHQLPHRVGFPIVHRPNIVLGTSRKAPTLIQLQAAASGQVVTPTFIGTQQVLAAQPSPQLALPLILGANGQVLVPKFIR